VTYSGTVTAAMEAVIGGVAGIAFSMNSAPGQGELDYTPAAPVVARIAKKVLQHGLPEGVLLNVNIPCLKGTELKEFALTRQGLRLYHDALDSRKDPRGQAYFWIGGDVPTGVDEEGTDFGALSAGCVSITPLQLDLTAYKALEKLRTWEWDG
jgi:5'-nucleotidase